MASTFGTSAGTSLVRNLGDGVGCRLRLPVRPHYRTGRHGDHHGVERRLSARAGSRQQSRNRNVDGQPLGHRGTADARVLRATFGRAKLLGAALARRGDLRLRRHPSAGRTEFGVRLFPLFPARARATGPGATERHTGTTWPEVERSADSTLIDRESGTVGTDIEATAESRLTADPNSARSDLESSAIFAGTDTDNGGTDRRLVRVVAWLVVVILLVTNAQSAKSGIG